MTGIDRRSLLAGGAALIVTFSLPRRAAASVRTVAADSVDGYLSVAPDGAVAVFAGMVDLGTGARAALRQMVAEELGLSPDRITLVEGDTALTPDQGSTGGSRGITVGGVQIRQAAATARARLLSLAAAALRRPVTELDARDGSIVARGGGESVSFAALIGGAAARSRLLHDRRHVLPSSRHSRQADRPARLRPGPSRRGHDARAGRSTASDRRASH